MDRERRSTRYRIAPIEFWNTEVLLSHRCGLTTANSQYKTAEINLTHNHSKNNTITYANDTVRGILESENTNTGITTDAQQTEGKKRQRLMSISEEDKDYTPHKLSSVERYDEKQRVLKASFRPWITSNNNKKDSYKYVGFQATLGPYF
jgi:hypothetical protein